MDKEYQPEKVSFVLLELVQKVFEWHPLQDNAPTRLEVARQLLATVEETLNDESRVCECCGATVRKDFAQWQALEAFRAAQTRITKATQSIAGDRLKKHYGVTTFTELQQLGVSDDPLI